MLDIERKVLGHALQAEAKDGNFGSFSSDHSQDEETLYLWKLHEQADLHFGITFHIAQALTTDFQTVRDFHLVLRQGTLGELHESEMHEALVETQRRSRDVARDEHTFVTYLGVKEKPEDTTLPVGIFVSDNDQPHDLENGFVVLDPRVKRVGGYDSGYKVYKYNSDGDRDVLLDGIEDLFFYRKI